MYPAQFQIHWIHISHLGPLPRRCRRLRGGLSAAFALATTLVGRWVVVENLFRSLASSPGRGGKYVYPVYLKHGRIHSVFGVSGDPNLCISHLDY